MVLLSVCEETFCVKRRGTPGTSGSNRLAVGVIHQITTCKNTIYIRLGGWRLNLYVPLGIQINLSVQKLGSGIVSDCNEQTGDG